MTKRLSTIVILCALGFSAAACDKCGDWLKPRALGPDMCKSDAPR